MVQAKPEDSAWVYPASEAVGVFASAEALEAAVDALERAGFDRAAISVPRDRRDGHRAHRASLPLHRRSRRRSASAAIRLRQPWLACRR
jgi:hypothetical protein